MDMREALTPIVDELRTAHPSTAIQLECPELRGAWDRDRLQQVFSNLLGNALVHGDPVKPVTVTAGAEALRMWVKVQNEGSPISPVLQSVLSAPFRSGERERGGLELVFTPMDLREALTPIVDELRTAHPSAAIQLECPELCGAWDRDRLQLVFANLIGNALVHGDPAKPVTVTAGAEAFRVWVEVHNEGPPIPQDLQPVLFNPFRRGERANQGAKAAGLGLGLYISNEVVHGHGGQIEIRSTAAEGTTFRVVLPCQAVTNSVDRRREPRVTAHS